MPYLIDGNNLLYAMQLHADLPGRVGLCKLLEPLARSEVVHVIFDGPPPTDAHLRQLSVPGLRLEFHRHADPHLIDAIEACTAPRRLTVVSSDRDIRTPAARRGCTVVPSEDFAPQLLALQTPAEPAEPPEPAEKQKGLAEDEAKTWYKEFGVE